MIPDAFISKRMVPSAFFIILILCHNGMAVHRRSASYQGVPYDTNGLEAYPAPSPVNNIDNFVKEVLRWHTHYCGKNRMCQEYTSSHCYKCSPCQCDLSCHDYGDCCPDLALEKRDGDDFPRPFTGNDVDVVTCKSVSLSRTSLRGVRENQEYGSQHPYVDSYYMVSSCPHTFSSDASACENSNEGPPVTSEINSTSGSSIVFKNIHCARCHGYLNVTAWKIQISCMSRQNLTSLSTPYRAVMSAISRPGCSVSYIPPEFAKGRKCFSKPGMIYKCNVTGHWPRRDAFLERACHSHLTPKLVNGVLYKNVFCFLCNTNVDGSHQDLTSCQRSPYQKSAPMTVLLDNRAVKEGDRGRHLAESGGYCGGTGVYDHKEGTCREVTCALAQHLVPGGCAPLFLKAKGLGYELYFGLRPNDPVDLSGDHDLLHHLPAEVEVYLGRTLLAGNVKLLDFAMAFNRTDDEGRCSQTASDLGVYVRLISLSITDQASLQRSLQEVCYSNFTIATRTWNMSLQAFPNEIPWHVMHPSRRRSPYSLSPCITIVANNHLEQREDGIMRVGTTTPDPNSQDQVSETPPFIRLSSLIACPHVRLFPHEYAVAGPGCELTLAWRDPEDKLSNDRFIMDLEGNVTICLEDFLPKVKGEGRRRTMEETILAYALLPISIFCLILCLIVYLVFAVLRTLPGKNNMVLISSLLCCHSALLVGYVIDDVSDSCGIVGVVSHYFALCLHCALLVCSYHVYAIFTTMHLSANIPRENRTFLLYVFFVIFAPIVVVVIVIVVNVALDENGSHIGYGKLAICLLSSETGAWTALFIPSIIIIIINLTLFCLTYASLRQNKDIETNITDERHVHFYIRATVLAFIAWTFYLISVSMPSPIIRIIFIVFQCLLGVYIFIALILTRRISGLLFTFCCEDRPNSKDVTSFKIGGVARNSTKNPTIVVTGFRKTGSESDNEKLSGNGSGYNANMADTYT
ncbi:uncharacterized protein LOC101860135 [Aplysia californica]|uniref:Uncharacterized protein LOC101860135 n=1 Tax=Aplysia californica TaxID=6500 RepID=A0ABM0JAF9_APLCA|nr:uncharacterized protein LOC101860135 [Aplysia californica]